MLTARLAQVLSHSLPTLAGAMLGKRPAPGQELPPYIQIAPMVDVTYRDFRRCMRIFTRRAELWTEMINANCILYCERSKLPESAAFTIYANVFEMR